MSFAARPNRGGERAYLYPGGYTITDDYTSALTTGLRLNTNGKVQADMNPTGTTWADQDTWLVSGTAANFECRMVTVSGTVSSGTVDSWLSLSSTRTWDVSRATPGAKVFMGTLQIRNLSGVIVASAAVEITSTVTP